MATLDELKVMIDAEIAPFRKKMKEVENQVKGTSDQVKNSTAKVREQSNSIGSAFGKLAKFAGFAILGKKLLDVGMYSTQTALEVSASMNQIKRQMGESSQSFLKWVNNNANAMNMGVGEATNYGAVYSNLFSGFIKDTNKLSAYTAKMLQTSAVVAEGSGRSITDVMERIRSGLLGNTEAIEDLGINVNVAMIESTEAFKKFANGQSWQQLDYQTQQQIRLMAILEQATAKYGNTLSNSVNGRISLFKSLMKDAALNLGNSMLPIINAIMPVLNSFAMVLKNVTAKLAEFIALMFNKKATVKDGVGGAVGDMGNAMKDAAGGAGDLADAVDDAGDSAGGLADNLGDSAKNAKKAAKELLGLLGFDEINILQKPKDDDAGGSGGGGKGGKGKGGGGGPFKDILPEVELTDMDNKFKSIFDGLGDKLKGLFDLFKKGFDAAFRPEGIKRIKTALDQIAKTMGEIATDPRVVNAFNRMAEKIAYALGQVTGSITTIGLGIGVFLAESIANGLGRQKERIIRALVALFDNVGNLSEAVGNIAQDFSSAFYDVITSTGAVRIGSAIVSTLLSLTSTIVEVGSKLAGSLFKGFEKVVVTSAPKISSVFQSLLDTVSPVFESIERSVNKFGDGLSRVYDEHVVPAINSIANAFNGLIDIIQILWENSWQPFAEFLSGVFGVSIEGISDLLGGGLLATLGLLADAIKLVADGFTVFSDWCKENKEPIVALITTWQTINFLSWAEQAGGLAGAFSLLGSKVSLIVGGIKNLGLAIKALTFDKLVSFGETIYLNTLYAKDFVVNSGKTIAQLGKTALELGKSALAWTAHAAKMGLATAAEFAHSVAAGVATAATWAFNAALAVLTSPITWIIAAIAALIAIGVLLYQNWDTVVEFAKTAWQGLCDFISGICQAIGEFFSGLWTKLQEIFEPIGQWFGEKFQQAWDAIVNIFSGIGEWFSGVFQGAWDAIVNIFTPIGSWFGQRWADVTSALANIGAWFTDMFQKAWTGLTNIFSKLGSWFGERWADVTNALSSVSNWFGEMFTNAYNAVKDAFSSIGDFFKGVWDTVKSIFVNAGQMVGEAVGGAFKSAVNAVLGTIENVVNGFIGMINGVLGVVRNLPGLGWVGSVSTVSLPRLARGGIVDSPTIAMIGEAGKEAVVPLENTGFIQTLGRVVSSAVVNAMAGVSPQGGFSGDGDIVIQIAGHEFGRVAIQEINKEHERAGQTLLKI
ncbi:TMP repeat family [Streptococcus pneumoniae]|uniref:TMP repeat family n=1 Tax=Streptococcus pneumoniae TaxID=1313 RepID=A0A4J1R9Y5_STREE|nr:TMP repeat family [Streptococcus pneumoniae]VJQ25356.1 TMP repeat family [Streptococcus pneumoniae]VJR99143.1 TMP repeat family [Streptococcus pneumoniae]VKM09150.1 TMP repeat family [Streptococcus pneumoniae]VMD12494.1 TMP repeat family [Streptococcus pneumoniae]